MSDLIPTAVLLAFIENKILSVKDGFLDVPKGKCVGNLYELTEEEKSDIAKNKYAFIFDDFGYFWCLSKNEDYWSYGNFYSNGVDFINSDGNESALYYSRSEIFEEENIYNVVSTVHSLAGMTYYRRHFFFGATYDLPNESRYATLRSIPELQHDNTGAVKVYKLHTDAVTREFKLEDYDLKCNYRVVTDASGVVTSTPLRFNGVDALLPDPASVTLTTAKYADVVFYANYRSNTTDSIIYHFSSGIILDSSTETPQYKIVFASYDVKAAKVTFVEKVLP